jgi:hypothetical protein
MQQRDRQMKQWKDWPVLLKNEIHHGIPLKITSMSTITMRLTESHFMQCQSRFHKTGYRKKLEGFLPSVIASNATDNI